MSTTVPLDMSALVIHRLPSALVQANGTALAPRTIRAYSSDLRTILEILGCGQSWDAKTEAEAFAARVEWAQQRRDRKGLTTPPPSHGTIIDRFFALDTPGVNAIVSNLQREFKPSTALRKFAALRTIWRTLRHAGLVDGDPFKGCTRPNHHTRMVSVLPRSTWTFFEVTPPAAVVEKVLAKRQKRSGSRLSSTLILRDLALICLFMMEGLKPGEITALCEGTYHPGTSSEPAKLTIARGSTTTVEVSLRSGTKKAMEAYITALMALPALTGGTGIVVKDASRPLFPNKSIKQRVSDRSVRRKIAGLLKALDLPPATAAVMRHTAIVDSLAAGCDPSVVRKRFGLKCANALDVYTSLVEGWKAEGRRAIEAPTREIKGAAKIPPRTQSAPTTAPIQVPTPVPTKPKGHPVYGRATPRS